MDAPGASGAFFTSGPAGSPQQLVLVLEQGQPLRAYRNGVRLPRLLLIPSYADGAIPIDPQLASWRPDWRLFLAPGGVPASWSGELFLIAVHSAALSDGQIQSSFEAWLDDSAPVAAERAISLPEDTPSLLFLSGDDPFDLKYSPRPPVPLIAEITSLPTTGTLYQPSTNDPPGKPAGASQPVQPQELPLPLPGGRLWYVPAKDVTGEAAATFEYRVVDAAGLASPAAAVRLTVAARNDPPTPHPATVEVAAGSPRYFELSATDIDSPLGNAVIRTLPALGRLYAAAAFSSASNTAGAGDVWGSEASRPPPLREGDVLPAGEWRLVYEYRQGGTAVTEAEREGELVLANDAFEFSACDAAAACSPDSARVGIQVLNGLTAHPLSALLQEDKAAVLALRGSRSSVGAAAAPNDPSAPSFVLEPPLTLRILSLPLDGQLFPCSPPPPGVPCVAPAESLPAALACSCCPPEDCELSPVGKGDPIISDAGLVIYRPNPDYFNCPAHALVEADCRTSVAGAPDRFTFEVVAADGRRSAPAEARVWVTGLPDAPRWVPPTSVHAQMLELAPLPPLHLRDPDGDDAAWGVQLSVESGFLTLNASALPALHFELGDGASDRFMYFTGAPSAVASGLEGATYRAIQLRNDSLFISIADPAGTEMVHLQPLEVFVTPADALPFEAAARPPLSALIATWSLVGVLALCLGLQLFSWLSRSCHPEEMESRAAERYEVLQEESWAADAKRAAPPVAQGETPDSGVAPGCGAAGEGSDTETDGVGAEGSRSLRSWAMENKQESEGHKQARLQRAIRRRGADPDTGGGTAAAGPSPAVRAVRLAVRPPPTAPSPSVGGSEYGTASPTSSNPATPMPAAKHITTTMLSMVFGPRARAGAAAEAPTERRAGAVSAGSPQPALSGSEGHASGERAGGAGAGGCSTTYTY
jgi:hypothetical protein